MKTNNIIPANTPIISQLRPKIDKEKIKELNDCKKKALENNKIIKK